MSKAKLDQHLVVGASPELRALVAKAAREQQTNWSAYARAAIVRQLRQDGYSLSDLIGR
jgi:hypothetical protein